MGNWFESNDLPETDTEPTLKASDEEKSLEFYRLSTAFGTNKQRELLICGYIHDYIHIDFPMDVIDIINLYYFVNTMYQFYEPLRSPYQFYSCFKLTEDNTLFDINRSKLSKS